MKKLILLFMTMALFVSCDDDDNKGGGGGGGTDTSSITFSYAAKYDKELKLDIVGYDVDINWGDGTGTQSYPGLYGEIAHEYDELGLLYNVKIGTDQVTSIFIDGISDDFLKITNLKINKLPMIQSLAIRGNEDISSFATTNYPLLTSLRLEQFTNLGQLNVSGSPNMESLYCANNSLGTLTMNRNAKLKIVDCRNNQLSAISLNNVPRLENLNCSGNGIMSLDIRKTPSIRNVVVDNNSITDFFIQDNNLLTTLSLKNNRLDANKLNVIFEALPEVENGTISIKGNPGTADCDKAIATDKGWTVSTN